MNKLRMMLMAGVGAALLAGNAVADDSGQGGGTHKKQHAHKGNTVSKPADNSQENYKYDRLFWDHSVPAWSYNELKNNEAPGYCLPRSTVVIGQSADLTSVEPKDDGGSDDAGTDDSSNDDGQAGDQSNDQSNPSMPAAPHFGGGAGSSNDGQDSGRNTPRHKAKGGDAEEATDKTEGKFLEATVNPSHGWLGSWFGTNDRGEAQTYLDKSENKDSDGNSTVCEGVTSPNPLPVDGSLYVKTDNALRFGWEYGALVVPFKMQLGGKHAFTGSSSVGAYLGYSVPLWDTGLVLSPIGFAGASNIAVPDNGGKKSSTQTMAGISYGLGVLTRVKDGFQVGLVFGKDHVDSRAYPYNDKTWVSFEIGYSFAQ